jgi:glucose-6-phosphate 1-dehydrogenase
MQKPDNSILVIFGASGDLTKRKLIPSLFELHEQDLLPEKFAVLGVGRSKLDDQTFRHKMEEALSVFGGKEKNTGGIDGFLDLLHYLSIDTGNRDDYAMLVDKINTINSEHDCRNNYIFYFSTPPSLYPVIAGNLAHYGLNNESSGWCRLIVEKPFGTDLKSAKELNENLLKDYAEHQIYRIDHYLGKETVQNILVTRFSNSIFEALWNRNYIHHIEITSAESIGVEDRGGYYDTSGALRDMVQNHLMQLVGLVAMEPPVSSDSNAIRNETLKVFQSLRPVEIEDVEKYVIRGQYVESKIGGEKVPGYRDESGVAEDSKTETFAALKFYIDNWRWGGVPFYIRSGKRLPTRVTEIVVHFKQIPHALFKGILKTGNDNNLLVIRIQPDEGILLKFGMKIPGQGFDVQTVNMDFKYSDLSATRIPSAYKRLLLDCMMGDSTLYTRGDAVEELWKFIDPILQAWQTNNNIPVFGYPAGTWGPEPSDQLIEGKDQTWRYPCKNLTGDGLYCEL